MCDFHEPFFGATYPDACCIDGFLWDLDSCDEPGGPLSSGGDQPCPQCNHPLWLEGLVEHVKEEGWIAREEGKPREYKHEKYRFEQDGDAEKAQAAWLDGWNERDQELASETPKQ